MCSSYAAHQKFIELDAYIDSLEEKSGALISILHKSQALFGYLPQEVQLHIARKLDIPAAKVNGVVTFYSFFSEEPKGEHVISLCMGTACFVRGAEDILREFENRLNVKAGETTDDGRFTLDVLRCVGACGLAPVVTIDGRVHGRVKKEQVSDLIRSAEPAEATASDLAKVRQG